MKLIFFVNCIFFNLDVPTDPPITEGRKRTVIFVHKITQPGQDLFVRGGIDGSRRPGIVYFLKLTPKRRHHHI